MDSDGTGVLPSPRRLWLASAARRNAQAATAPDPRRSASSLVLDKSPQTALVPPARPPLPRSAARAHRRQTTPLFHYLTRRAYRARAAARTFALLTMNPQRQISSLQLYR